MTGVVIIMTGIVNSCTHHACIATLTMPASLDILLHWSMHEGRQRHHPHNLCAHMHALAFPVQHFNLDSFDWATFRYPMIHKAYYRLCNTCLCVTKHGYADGHANCTPDAKHDNVARSLVRMFQVFRKVVICNTGQASSKHCSQARQDCGTDAAAVGPPAQHLCHPQKHQSQTHPGKSHVETLQLPSLGPGPTVSDGTVSHRAAMTSSPGQEHPDLCHALPFRKSTMGSKASGKIIGQQSQWQSHWAAKPSLCVRTIALGMVSEQQAGCVVESVICEVPVVWPSNCTCDLCD